MGLRGRRAASIVPTATAGTTPTAVVIQSASSPPGPREAVMLSSGTLAKSRPRVNTPNATAATSVTRGNLKTVLTGRPPLRRPDRDEPTLSVKRSENVTTGALAALSDRDLDDSTVRRTWLGLSGALPRRWVTMSHRVWSEL